MTLLSVDQIDYRILSDAETIIESCNDSIPTIFPRNCIAFGGNHFRIAHLQVLPCAKTIIVPYSVQGIFFWGYFSCNRLESLVFEFGSELESIAESSFVRSELKSVFSLGLSILLAALPFLIPTLYLAFILSVFLPSGY
jgi:hypothetical protein